MLILAETELHLPEGILLNQSFGSIFHGALISELDREWAERCMNSGFARTANIFGERGEALLASGSTDRRGFCHILQPMMRKDSLCLAQKDMKWG